MHTCARLCKSSSECGVTHGRLTISKWGQEQLDLAELRGNVRQLNIMMSEKRFNVIMDIMQACSLLRDTNCCTPPIPLKFALLYK